MSAPATSTPAAAPAATLAAAAAATPFQSASLYVGDLHNDVTESLLFELFNRVGPVASIRVCRDSVTRRSLGYAYVNFHNVQDAERSLDTMNFTEIRGKPCRIMWSQRDPSLRKSGVGNVFVRNLAPSVDNKGLYDTFSVFGNILSCKVANDETGASKGYGYVHFETAEAAQDAISKFNGTLIEDVEVSVGAFVRRQDRAGQADWTNLYVKQFPVGWEDEKLKELFAAFGSVVSVAVSREAEGGKSKGFGFVNMEEHGAAAKALEELNGKTLEDGEGGNFELYVSVMQKKGERQKEIKGKIDALNAERVSKYQGMNLYVKNIADTVTDEAFREAFASYGTITSARIMHEANELKTSKGFGFVCFSSPEEATRAVTEMNGKALGGKPLVVTLHQRKDLRRAHLAATYAPQGMRFPGQQGGMQGQGGPMAGGPPFMNMGMYMQQPGGQFPGQGMGGRGGMMPYPYQGGGRGMGGPRSPNGNMGPGGRGPMGGNQQGFFQGGNGPNSPYGGNNMPYKGGNRGAPMGQGGYMGQGGPNMRGRGGPMGGPGMPMGGRGGPMGGPQQMGGRGGFPNPQMQGGMMMQGGNNMQQQQMRGGGVKFNNQVRNQGGMQQGGMNNEMIQQQQQAAPVQQQQQGKLDFSDAALASADPLTQKNMIGEHLYPLIFRHQPEQAGKITGMLLEMDNGELLNLIESPDALMNKIDEALSVLRNHKAASEQE